MGKRCWGVQAFNRQARGDEKGHARAGSAWLAGEQLVDGLPSDALAAAEKSLLLRLQIDSDGNVVCVVHRPALNQLHMVTNHSEVTSVVG